MADTGAQRHAPGWYADPHRRYQLRWYDGTRWTEHVSTSGEQRIDPAGADRTGQSMADTVVRGADPVTWSGARARWQGGGHLLDSPILVVSQRAQVVEVDAEYRISDPDGNPLGYVHQVGQSQLKKAVRVLSSMEDFMTHTFEILDAHHTKLLEVSRPAKVFRSRIIVKNAAGAEIGQIVQQNVIGKIRFSLEAGGYAYGAINAENWRAWDFHVVDHTGTEIGRITKTFEGLARAMFTTADNYVVQLHRPLEEPLRSLVVASGVSVDTALKQEGGGFN